MKTSRILFLLAAIVSVFLVRSAAAAPVSDNSIFFDHFTGTGALTATGHYAQVGTANFVQDGNTLVTLNAASSNGVRTTALNFSASPNEWVAETRFRVNGTLNTLPTRPLHVLAGNSTPTPLGTDTWVPIGFDLRLLEAASDGTGTGSTFDLVWYGWDSVDENRVPQTVSGGAGLLKNTFYTLTAHRKADDAIDIYLDGALLATKPLIVGQGSGNVGQENPDLLFFGSGSSLITSNITWDYISLGAVFVAPVVPEPSTFMLLALGGCGLLLRRRGKSGGS